jgi:DNA-binding beta-propeller fold protein YncE
LINPEERGFKLKKQIIGTITASKAKRLFDKTINIANMPAIIYNGTFNCLFFNLKSKTIITLQVIESRQAKILGFNNVPTGYGAPCSICIIPTYVSRNGIDKRTINVTAYDSLLKK